MKCPQPYVVRHSEFQQSEYPCGRCLACRQLRARDWAQRIKFEMEKPNTAGDFVTFTYNDENNKTNYLDKTDLQKLMKRIRKHHKIKYYACGEYGEQFGRRHYHALIMHDEKPIRYEAYWKKGEIHTGALTDASISYCTGYMLKANPVPAKTPRAARPFHAWSRGIGDDWMKGKTYLEMAREGNIPRRWRALADPEQIPPEVYKNPKDSIKGWQKYGRRKEQRWFADRAAD